MNGYQKIIIFLVCIFITYQAVLKLQDDSKSKPLLVPDPDPEPLLVPGRKFPEFLAANEQIRKRFLEKRKANIFEGRSPNDVTLWEHRQGWQYVWNSFTPVFTCPHLIERVGTAKDGGKWVCGLELFEGKNEECVIYSLGVGWDSTFEVEMVQRTNCSVYAYDFSVNGMAFPSNLNPEIKKRIHFFKLGLGSSKTATEDTRFRTLTQLMKENGHTWIDFLKVDIEGAEFAILPELGEEFGRLPFGHLNLEVHLNEAVGMEDSSGQSKEFKKLYDLWTFLEDKGLRAYFWEDNYYWCTFGRKTPVVMEYAFLNVMDDRNKLIQF